MKRKGISKIRRAQVLAKYDNKCAYCGKYITNKQLTVDHLVPLGCGTKEKGKDLDATDNLMPSCKRCNSFKANQSLEDFRLKLFFIYQRLYNVFVFNVARDYNLVTLKDFDNKFYFEKLEEEKPEVKYKTIFDYIKTTLRRLKC